MGEGFSNRSPTVDREAERSASDQPTVSVLLPCFNAQRFLPAALDSLLGQSFGDLEILALDDGSSDQTPRILAAYAARDARIRVLRTDTNQGLIATLNRGVGEACGQFIARLDADDVAAPRRLELQVAALRSRPDIGVVGTAIEMLGEDGRSPRPRPLRCREPGGARFAALLATPLEHTTIMARTRIMRAHPYGATLDSVHTEDYEMFSRMLQANVALANLDETLVAVRVRPAGVSLSHERLQIRNFLACSRRHLEWTRGLQPDLRVHRVLVNRMDRTTTALDLVDGLRLLRRLERECAVEVPAWAQEIHAVADLQRVDILAQAALRGRSRVRLAAAGLAVRYAHRMLSPVARHHLATKLSSGPTTVMGSGARSVL